MQYGLLPTEAAISFMFILIYIYSHKQKFENAKTTMYKIFLNFSIIYGIAIFGGIVLLKYFGRTILFTIFWRGQAVVLFMAWVAFYIYCMVTVYDIKETNLIKIIKSRVEFIILTVILGIYTFIAMIPTYISLFDNIDPNNIEIFTADSSKTILIIFIISLVALLSRFIPHRKKLSKEFIFSSLFGCFVCMGTCVFHMFYHANTFLPMAFVIFAYMLYFYVENPDIILLNETKKFQKESNNNKDELDFLIKIDASVDESINEIQKYSSLTLKEEYNKENLVKDMDTIINHGNNVLSKMNDVFELSKVDNKDKSIERKYELKKLISEIYLFTKDNLNDKKLKLFVNINPNISSKLYGDYDKIYQSIIKIITTSIEETKIGRITISISSTKLGNNETILFKVADTSTGLKEEELSKVFSEEGNPNITLAKKNIESFGGKVWLESLYLMGNKYFIQFKQKIADQNPIGEIKEFNVEEKQNETKDYTNKKVLIVDDDIKNAKLTKKILSKYNFEVEIIDNGIKCINKIKSEEQYNMIFMDIMMPEMDGVETLKALKELEGYVLPPIIALTANAISGMKELYLSEGFDDYLSKPINKNELEIILNKYLE